MNKNTLIILAAITLTVVIVAAVVVNQQRSPTELRKESLLPDLVAQLNDAAAISLIDNRHKTLLERDNDTWLITNSDDYPALQDRVRRLLIDLTELQTLERKTRNPDLYYRLHVQDPSQPDSKSVQVTVSDRQGRQLADVIIGKPRTSRVTNIQTGLYVRKPEAEHALLVEGQVDASAEKTGWFEPDILDIPAERIREVSIRHPDGEQVRAWRDQPDQDFRLADLPEDRALQSRTLLNRFGSVLHEVRASDVRGRNMFEFPASTVEVFIHTFDGLVAKVLTIARDDRYYAHFEFEYDGNANPVTTAMPDADPLASEELAADMPLTVPVDREVVELQERHGNWVYQIPEFKYDILTRTLDSLTRQVTQ